MIETVDSAPAVDVRGVDVAAPPDGVDREILTPEALEFVAGLERRFGPRIDELIARRAERRERMAAGEPLGFLAETREIREGDWCVPAAPADLRQRFVEITGPADRKMMINALNSGADVFMADFEDAMSPTWANIVQGQANVRDAVRRELSYDDPESGKFYRLGGALATLLVRPRGLHLSDRNVLVDGARVHAALLDAGLFLHHSAGALVAGGSAPYLYLPKLESHQEASLWNSVFAAAEDELHLPHACIRPTVLIETLPAAFEMDEILFALRDRAAGLNCGRWDYIFSCIKCRQHDAHAIYPDRSQVTMTQPPMRAYTKLAIQTCHRRGTAAIGGMSAFIPSRDPAANANALAQVRADKERESMDGHDGTWVAHPGLVDIAREAFLTCGMGPYRPDATKLRALEDAGALLAIPDGTRTEVGLRLNMRVGIRYIESWLGGRGAVPLYHLMEDAATAEISRAQVWQWMRWNAELDDGRRVTPELVERMLGEESLTIARELGSEQVSAGRLDEARNLFAELVFAPRPEEFFTTVAYERLDQ